jgi:hypothetical protein
VVGPDADPLADAVGAAGAVGARIAPGVFWAGAVAGCEVFVDGGAAAAGRDDCAGAEASLGSEGATAVGAGAAGLEGGVAIASTAPRQDADNLD